MAGIPLSFFNISVTPTAAKDQEWRQEVAWSYPGILAAAVAATTTDWWSPDLHRHGMNMGYTGN